MSNLRTKCMFHALMLRGILRQTNSSLHLEVVLEL
nr:MAG TPA: hypothetical protein [Crassvirales sp.]